MAGRAPPSRARPTPRASDMTPLDPTTPDPTTPNAATQNAAGVRPYPALGDRHPAGDDGLGSADHDAAHDRGLLHDLSVLAAHRLEVASLPAFVTPRLHRRGALKLLGGASLGLVLAACGSSSSSSSGASGSSTSAAAGATSTTLGATTSSTVASASATVTDAIPEETGGPYPADGTNGPDVLTESGIVREDITTSFGDYSGTAEGLPLGVDLTVVYAGDGSPFPGAALYLWHANRDGQYSLYTAPDQNYLRGVQVAGDDGTLSFSTIYPGCYDGRWPHMHFEVYPSVGEITSVDNRLVTSQLAMPEDLSSEVYGGTEGYETSVSNLTRTSLATDMVFSDGADLQLPTVSGTPAAGDLRIALTIAVNG